MPLFKFTKLVRLQVRHMPCNNIFIIWFIFDCVLNTFFRLGKQVKSVLKSCGWTDNVHDYMVSRKRLRVQEAGNSSCEGEMK